jgi:hypothetical protein
MNLQFTAYHRYGLGLNTKIVSERLGYASIVLILDTYSHVLPTMQREATDELEAIFLRKIGTK